MWEESKQGPPRKYYEITSNGKEFLSELDDSWIDLRQSIEIIKSKNTHVK